MSCNKKHRYMECTHILIHTDTSLDSLAYLNFIINIYTFILVLFSLGLLVTAVCLHIRNTANSSDNCLLFGCFVLHHQLICVTNVKTHDVTYSTVALS